MKRVVPLLATLLAAMTVIIACGPRFVVPSPDQVRTGAASALGGRDRILAIHTLLIEGHGGGDVLLETVPKVESEPFTITNYRLAIDLSNQRWRMEYMRAPVGNETPQQHVIFGIDGSNAYDRINGAKYSRATSEVAAFRRGMFLHHPLTIIREMLTDTTSTYRVRLRGESATLAVDMVTAPQECSSLMFSRSYLPSIIESTTSSSPHAIEHIVRTVFTDYRDVNGVKLPFHITTEMNRNSPDHTEPKLDIVIERQTIDADIGDLSTPK
jgi:hypothetical protein